MDKRKIANKKAKDKLLSALITLLQQREWSKITITDLVTTAKVARASYYRNFGSLEELLDYGLTAIAQAYHHGCPIPVEDFHNRELIRYKFRFYKEHRVAILGFHRGKAPMTLLEVITDCVIDAKGDMPTSAMSKYQLYYYAGAFYNMVLYWLEGGAIESPEAMAEAFLRLTNHSVL